MKTLFNAIAVMFIHPLFCQVIQVDVFEYQPHVKWEKTNHQEVLQNPEWSGYKEEVNGTYYIDLDNKTISLLNQGKLTAPVPLKKVVREGTKTIVYFDDATSIPDDYLESWFVIDTQAQTSCHSWYDEFGAYTRVHENTKCKISESAVKKAF